MNKLENFNYFGIMLECSRNAVPTVEYLKEYIDDISKMGYNCLQLYTEDTYEIDGEEYFGYLRGRFTKEELKEINSYGKQKGVEIMPAIQTLAHLNCALRWGTYWDVTDCRDILLIGEEKTYQLIEKMVATWRECVDTKYINIGMDEAHFVGLGKFLSKNGYRDRFSILCEHLNKVVDIVKKYGFTPIMWSDMFFRLINNGVYRANTSFNFPDGFENNVPKEVALCYWDYYSEEPEVIDNMLVEHKRFNNEIWYAGGCWSWSGFTPSNYTSFVKNEVAIKCCLKHNIKNYLVTIWGDDGHETSKIATHPSLFHAICVAKGITDIDVINSEFEKLFGIPMTDCLKLDYPNEIQHKNNIHDYAKSTADNPSKYMLYNDPFSGIFDTTANRTACADYKRYAKELLSYVDNEKFGYAFKVMQTLCDVLSIKYDLGVKTRKAYNSGDKDKIKQMIKKYKSLIKKLYAFHSAFKAQWFKENKPFGFEVQDARIGGLIMRVNTCMERLQAYVDGQITSIPELEAKLLPVYLDKKNGKTIYYNQYGTTYTACVNTHNPM